VVTAIEPLAGTAEETWARWSAPRSWPALQVDDLGSVVVLAAHPDDEVLGAGGTIARLCALGRPPRFVWASDGEASHPEQDGLAARRRAESQSALGVLGADRADLTWLRLPDGRLEQHEQQVAAGVAAVVRPGDTVLAPWAGDGHPDHEACGRAARAVGAPVVEYPVWTWSWAAPGDVRVPWQRARRVDLAADEVVRKRAAIECFASQVAPDEGEPVLPERVLAHFARPYEVLLR
jgi:LmbE family N-acetylglucosaminyl deacetylase